MRNGYEGSRSPHPSITGSSWRSVREFALDLIDLGHKLQSDEISFQQYVLVICQVRCQSVAAAKRHWDRFKTRVRALGFAPPALGPRAGGKQIHSRFKFDLNRALDWARFILGETLARANGGPAPHWFGPVSLRRENAVSREELLLGSGQVGAGGAYSMDSWRNILPLEDPVANDLLDLLAHEGVPMTIAQLGEHVKREFTGRRVSSRVAARRAAALAGGELGPERSRDTRGSDVRGKRDAALRAMRLLLEKGLAEQRREGQVKAYIISPLGEEAAVAAQIIREETSLEYLDPEQQHEQYFARLEAQQVAMPITRPRRRSRTVVSGHASRRRCVACLGDHSLSSHRSHRIDAERRLVDLLGMPYEQAAPDPTPQEVDTSFDFGALAGNPAGHRHLFDPVTRRCKKRGCKVQADEPGQGYLLGAPPILPLLGTQGSMFGEAPPEQRPDEEGQGSLWQ